VTSAITTRKEARDDLRKLPADIRAKVINALDDFLSFEPDKASTSRMKRLHPYASLA